MKKREQSYNFDRNALINELMIEAKVANIPLDVSCYISKLVADDVERWLNNRYNITELDYRKAVKEAIKKYNADLAYIYFNRDKIV